MHKRWPKTQDLIKWQNDTTSNEKIKPVRIEKTVNMHKRRSTLYNRWMAYNRSIGKQQREKTYGSTLDIQHALCMMHA